MITRWSFHFWLKLLFTIVWHAHLFAILYQQVMLSNTLVTPSISWRYLNWQFSIYCSGGSWLHPLNNCTTFQPTQNKGRLDILMTLNQGLMVSMMTCRALMTMTTCYFFCSCMLVKICWVGRSTNCEPDDNGILSEWHPIDYLGDTDRWTPRPWCPLS